MTTQSTVPKGQKIGIIALNLGFVALGGFFGYLADMIMRFTSGPDPVRQIVCITIGAAIMLSIMVFMMTRGVKEERNRIRSSGGESSGIDFMTLYFLSTVNGDSGSFGGGNSSGGGWFDGGGGGWGGGDSGGSCGGGDSGGGSF